jgi:hypothetical protein
MRTSWRSFRSALAGFGPGLLVTAAFIAPGTVTTASRAGAAFGTALLWAVAFSTWPPSSCRKCPGEYQGYLIYREEIPAGWCRVGPRRTWPKLCKSFDLDPQEEVYSFTCFGIRGELQGKGLVHTLVESAPGDLARRGVRFVEACASGAHHANTGDRHEPRRTWDQ